MKLPILYIHCDICKIPVIYSVRCYECTKWYVLELHKFAEALSSLSAIKRAPLNDEHIQLILCAITDYNEFVHKDSSTHELPE